MRSAVEHAACSAIGQPAHEKLLNRRYRAGALTSAPVWQPIIRMVSRRADPMQLGCGLAIGHKKIARRNTWICSLSPALFPARGSS